MQETGLTPAERTLRAQIAAHDSWAKTEDRSARPSKARQAAEDKRRGIALWTAREPAWRGCPDEGSCLRIRGR